MRYAMEFNKPPANRRQESERSAGTRAGPGVVSAVVIKILTCLTAAFARSCGSGAGYRLADGDHARTLRRDQKRRAGKVLSELIVIDEVRAVALLGLSGRVERGPMTGIFKLNLTHGLNLHLLITSGGKGRRGTQEGNQRKRGNVRGQTFHGKSPL